MSSGSLVLGTLSLPLASPAMFILSPVLGHIIVRPRIAPDASACKLDGCSCIGGLRNEHSHREGASVLAYPITYDTALVWTPIQYFLEVERKTG